MCGGGKGGTAQEGLMSTFLSLRISLAKTSFGSLVFQEWLEVNGFLDLERTSSISSAMF